MPDNTDHDHSDNRFDGFSIDEIKENFRTLAQELENDEIKSIGKILETAEDDQYDVIDPTYTPFYRGYNPGINDFLERASTVEECREVIDYCLKTGEITQEDADKYYYRLEKGGPRAFGTRQPGYYDKKL